MRSAASEAAYAEFVTARQRDLRRLAYAVCGDWESADALVHAALVRLYVVWSRQRRDGTEESFVRRLVVRADVPTPPGRTARGSTDGIPPGTPLALEVLWSLPPLERKAVLLRDWVGLTPDEAADDLGLPPGRVESLTARGRAALDNALAGERR